MRREQRLRKRREFLAVFKEGKTWANNLVLLKALANELGVSRFGFSTVRRIGTAVDRNRVKRRLREAVRQTPCLPSWDMVFIGREKAAAAPYEEIKRAVENALSRAHLLQEGGSSGE